MVGRPFPKGVSGNPNGRPPIPKIERDIRQMALAHADLALKTLVTAANMVEEEPSSAVSAAKELLNRGFGQSTEHKTLDVNVTHHDARKRVESKLARVIDGTTEESLPRLVN